jgi:hypothetical protein
MGMSGIEVYECRIGPGLSDHYYDIVWRGRRRWSVAYPWDSQKHELVGIGRNIRYRANMDEQFEKVLRQREDAEAQQKLQDEDDKEVMTRDICRTVFDKPLYFY